MGKKQLIPGEKDQSNIEVVDYKDPKESGQRMKYSIIETVIYVGWPMILFCISQFCFGILWISLLLFFLSLAWPYLKGVYANFIAKRKGIDDPREVLRSSSFFYDGFCVVGAPALREIRKHSALSRSLDVIYNNYKRFGILPKKFQDDSSYYPLMGSSILHSAINLAVKKWSFFWINMPVAQDVRSRLEIIAELYKNEILKHYQNGERQINICEIAGGQLQAVVMGIRRALDSGVEMNYRVVSIEPDNNFAIDRAKELIRVFGLNEGNFCFINTCISTQNKEKMVAKILESNGYNLGNFHVVTCIGLSDYYYTKERVAALLNSMKSDAVIIAANISDNFVERFFLHVLIQWPKMKYRPLSEWAEIVRHVFPDRSIKIITTPLKIFNIAVIR